MGAASRPRLRGEPVDRGPVFWHYPHYSNQGGGPGAAVRDGDWKLVEWYEDGSLELYNLQSDLGEQTDLADAHPDQVTRLKTLLDDWRAEVGARMPTPNPDYRPK